MAQRKRESGAFKLVVVVVVGAALVGGMVLLGGRTPPPVTSAVDAAPPPAAEGDASLDASAPAPSAATDASIALADAATPSTAADRNAMLEAASAGDLPKVQELAGRGVAVTGTLEHAAKSGSVGLVTWLFDHGVDPHEDEGDAVPPLLAADASEGVVNLLLARGVKEPAIVDAARAGAANAVARDVARKKTDALARTAEGEPVLFVAIADNAGAPRLAMVDALLRGGADPNTTFDKTSALAQAVTMVSKKSEGALDVVKHLLDKGALVDLDAVANAGSLEKADAAALQELFLAHKVAPGAAYAMILNEKDPKTIARIGAKGVDWTSEPKTLPPTPPLVLAARDLDVERVRALLAAGAPVDRAGEGDEAPLFSAIDAATPDSAEAASIVNALLAKGANANKRTAGGRRPLHAASEKGEEAIVKALLAKGAHVDDEEGGVTALEAAESNGHQEIAKLLIAKGAKKK